MKYRSNNVVVSLAIDLSVQSLKEASPSAQEPPVLSKGESPSRWATAHLTKSYLPILLSTTVKRTTGEPARPHPCRPRPCPRPRRRRASVLSLLRILHGVDQE